MGFTEFAIMALSIVIFLGTVGAVASLCHNWKER
jgi:hypothetical protein